jgi:hypothetical protein
MLYFKAPFIVSYADPIYDFIFQFGESLHFSQIGVFELRNIEMFLKQEG